MDLDAVTREIFATFASADGAQAARRLLEAEALAPHSMTRISAERVLHVDVTRANVEHVAQALRDSGALGIQYTERPKRGGWFSHLNAHVTGAGIAPGEGDGEAGSVDERRS